MFALTCHRNVTIMYCSALLQAMRGRPVKSLGGSRGDHGSNAAHNFEGFGIGGGCPRLEAANAVFAGDEGRESKRGKS